LSGTEKVNEEEANAPKIEPSVVPLDLETKAKIEAVLLEVKSEELPQHMPPLPVETEIPQESYPVETKLELYAVPQSINKGNFVTLRGKLSSSIPEEAYLELKSRSTSETNPF
jgi:hypothetical protein